MARLTSVLLTSATLALVIPSASNAAPGAVHGGMVVADAQSDAIAAAEKAVTDARAKLRKAMSTGQGIKEARAALAKAEKALDQAKLAAGQGGAGEAPPAESPTATEEGAKPPAGQPQAAEGATAAEGKPTPPAAAAPPGAAPSAEAGAAAAEAPPAAAETPPAKAGSSPPAEAAADAGQAPAKPLKKKPAPGVAGPGKKPAAVGTETAEEGAPSETPAGTAAETPPAQAGQAPSAEAGATADEQPPAKPLRKKPAVADTGESGKAPPAAPEAPDDAPAGAAAEGAPPAKAAEAPAATGGEAPPAGSAPVVELAPGEAPPAPVVTDTPPPPPPAVVKPRKAIAGAKPGAAPADKPVPPIKVVIGEKAPDGRVVIRENGQLVIRHDEDRRFEASGGRVFEQPAENGHRIIIVNRPDGSQVTTERDGDGNVIRRTRKLPDGTVITIIDAKPVDKRKIAEGVDYMRRLPPVVLNIPMQQYVVESQAATPQVLEQTLIAPPVEEVERPYSLEEIRQSGRLRDKVRRIDVDTVNFEFGQATLAEDQVAELDGIGKALAAVVARNPGEVFMVEGHTDAVGSDLANLALSDRRAESVAEILTYYYKVPPENLVTQGYGEQYLKVPTEGPERENRRVTVRRITPLLKGVASR